jgi:hypothetical protein
MTEFLREKEYESEEVVTPLMLDGTYLSRNIATLGPFGEPDSRRLERQGLLMEMTRIIDGMIEIGMIRIIDGCQKVPKRKVVYT